MPFEAGLEKTHEWVVKNWGLIDRHAEFPAAPT
jgi:hypothetical protein